MLDVNNTTFPFGMSYVLLERKRYVSTKLPKCRIYGIYWSCISFSIFSDKVRLEQKILRIVAKKKQRNTNLWTWGDMEYCMAYGTSHRTLMEEKWTFQSLKSHTSVFIKSQKLAYFARYCCNFSDHFILRWQNIYTSSCRCFPPIPI